MAAAITVQPRPQPVELDLHNIDIRKSRSSPLAPKRYLGSSWDDIIASRKPLRASLNNEDLSLLLDSIESTRSPAISRLSSQFPLSPSPSAQRFLHSISPSIPRRTSQSLLSNLFSNTLNNSSTTIPIFPSSDSFLTLSSSNIPSLSMSATGVPIGAPSNNTGSAPHFSSSTATFAIPTSTATTNTNNTNSSQSESSIQIPQPVNPAPSIQLSQSDQNSNNNNINNNNSTTNNNPNINNHMEQHSDFFVSNHSHNDNNHHNTSEERVYYDPQMGYFAEPVVPISMATQFTAGQSLVGMHITAESEAFNYNYAIQNPKCCPYMEINSTTVDGSMPCNKCGKDYRTVLPPDFHCADTCKNKNFCPYCVRQSFINDTLAKQANRKSHHVKTYKCTTPECPKTFITRKEQQNHIARHSAEPRYYCEIAGCNCKYTTKSSLDLHVTRIHGERRYKCDLCEERYAVKGDLNQHMKRKHMKQRKTALSE